ncbi:MAG TPA: PEP/pyruvate-binding domain-containing protein [Methanomassiliicoccales archaeon]|nr:PEP/pyruvate-binding domain-containing protein [Methanomassiliicoccales archaeon]
MSEDIISLSGKGEVKDIGGKARNLTDLMADGFPVPEGIVIGTAAYERFLNANGLRPRIEEILRTLDHSDGLKVARCAESIRGWVLSTKMEKGLVDNLHMEMSTLGPEGLWAVRSSAIAEDLEQASFAGQQDTFLNVSLELVSDHIKKCWASYWNDRAINYRHDNKIGHLDSGMAVIVQRMVNADSSGIMFTSDPVSGEERIIIESSWGLGESIASGLVTPDRFVCDPRTGELRESVIGSKAKAIFLSPEGEKVVDVPAAEQKRASLSRANVEKVAKLGRALQEHMGSPQDIEWAAEGDKIYLLQSRPITTIGGDHTLWTRAYGDEYWADVTSPLFFSVLGPWLTKYVNWEGSAIMGYYELTDKELLHIHKGHVYFNAEVLEGMLVYNPKFSRTKELLNYFPEKDQARIANAKTRTFRRLLAEVRIALLDRDGVILSTDKAYKKWASGFLEWAETFDAMDLTEIPDEKLEDLVWEMERRIVKHYRLIRYGMVTHSIGTNMMVKRWLQDWLNDSSGALYSRVISGLKGNKTIETNIALNKLADVARDDPYVRGNVLGLSSREMTAKMNDDPKMSGYREEFVSFLTDYGHRSHTRELYFPRWGDDPRLVADIVRSLVSSSRLDLKEMERRRIKEREEAEKDILAKIRDLDKGYFKAGIFRIVMHFAQTYLIFRENQRYFLDHILYRERRIYMEFSRRFLSKGWIGEGEDIFFLSKEEIFALAKGIGKEALAMIPERKNVFHQWKGELPPKFLKGSVEFDDTVVVTGSAVRLTGTSASPGIASGPVRVVESIEQLSEVKEGEILITSNTDPGWTAVFSKIGGLITETGGILSHGAVVSREYGIPAVTAVKSATKIFITGQWITLDGNEGLIYIREG